MARRSAEHSLQPLTHCGQTTFQTDTADRHWHRSRVVEGVDDNRSASCSRAGKKALQVIGMIWRDRDQASPVGNARSAECAVTTVPRHFNAERLSPVKELKEPSKHFRTSKYMNVCIEPFIAIGHLHKQPRRWPTFLTMLIQILKEGMGLSFGLTNSKCATTWSKTTVIQTYVRPKLRFLRGLKAKAPSAVTASVYQIFTGP